MRRTLRDAPFGWALSLTVVGLALFGPWFAPYSPTEFVGSTFSAPSWHHVLGTDFLGRDGLSRVLWGGRSVVLVAVSASAIAYVIGIAVGLLTGFTRGFVDPAFMRTLDVVQAFPPIILVLLIISALGRSIGLLILAVAAVFLPGIARLVRAATVEVSTRPFVEASIARGEHTRVILVREILPNIGNVLLADFSIRFTGTVLLAAALSYIGLGPAPPASDWALLVSENRGGMDSNPAIILVPALLVALLTVGGNLVADGIARRRGLFLERERSR
jgi:peptide/nickel transport system permease protein